VRTALIAIVLVAASNTVHGETLLALAGASDSENSDGNSYAWQLQFQEPISSYLSGSLSWLNEGHMPAHHRDGAAAQLWLDAPSLLERVAFSLGAGPYIYFDTETASSERGYHDIHSAAAMLSASMAVDVGDAWFLDLRVNEIYAPGDINTASFLLGAGYHFGRFDRADPAAASGGDVGASYARQQLQVFGGVMIYNQLQSQQDSVVGLEYRLSLRPWAAWSAAWFYNPGNAISQRNQVASQMWLVHAMADGRLSVSAGLGVYMPLGSQPGSAATTPAGVSGLSALRAEWNCSARSSVIVSWYRSFTNDDNDRDLITLGYGWRFGG
jgi:hypothetical protein